MGLKETKAALAQAQEHYIAISETAPAIEVRRASDAVKALKEQLIADIVAGADPCSGCGRMPHGMEHQVVRSKVRGVEYEVGCTECPPIEWIDGSLRQRRARGGTMPHHAVEAWNAGPEYWVPVKGEANG